MKNHHLWMIIGCVLPLLFIFFLPFFGAGSGELLFVFIVLCFGVHLLMMGHHRNHDGGNHESPEGRSHHGSH
jgi:hypothetical protein